MGDYFSGVMGFQYQKRYSYEKKTILKFGTKNGPSSRINTKKQSFESVNQTFSLYINNTTLYFGCYVPTPLFFQRQFTQVTKTKISTFNSERRRSEAKRGERFQVGVSIMKASTRSGPWPVYKTFRIIKGVMFGQGNRWRPSKEEGKGVLNLLKILKLLPPHSP